MSCSSNPSPVRARPGARGFTLIEVLMSLAVFVVGLSGIIALQSKSLESQASAKYINEAERLAQRLMSEARSTGFGDLVTKDASGGAAPLPHLNDDLGEYPFGGRPWDKEDDAKEPVVKKDFYHAVREVNQVMLKGSVAAGSSVALTDAVRIDIYVLWIDDSNSSYPPPAALKVEDLKPTQIQAGHADYKPYVQGVHLRTVRLNDG